MAIDSGLRVKKMDRKRLLSDLFAVNTHNTNVFSKVTLVGTLFTCVAGAIMHFSCTTMLRYFVKSGATKEAHDIMILFFIETMVTTALCNIGMFMVCISLFVAIIKGKTCLPKRYCKYDSFNACSVLPNP